MPNHYKSVCGILGTSDTAYAAVPDVELDQDESDSLEPAQNLRKRWNSRLFAGLGFTLLATAIVIHIHCLHSHVLQGSDDTRSSSSSNIQNTCTSPTIRRSWHAVSRRERLDYVSAVMCLQTKPSRLGLDHSLYIDFPYTHIWHGHDWHDAVPFFVQHRWFLHIYETALRTECGYRGSMLYWDWTLDWQDPYSAPVFDKTHGFGGDGNPAHPGFRGGCVDEGPLAQTVMPYIEQYTESHCLSRNFINDTADLDFWRQQWHPDKVTAALELETLIEFVRRVEFGMHRALSHLVGGDYTIKGAPVDPLFFLHHAQLDRIYWLWQQRKPEVRCKTYEGPKTREDEHNTARLTDGLYYGDLAPAATVADALDIRGGKLCYTYV